MTDLEKRKSKEFMTMFLPRATIARRLAAFQSRRQASTVVLIEHRGDSGINQGSLAAITAARTLNQDLHFVVPSASKELPSNIAKQITGLAPAAVHLAVHSSFARPPVPETLAPFLQDAIKATDASHVFAAHSAFGKSVMPRVAAALDVAPISDILSITPDGQTFERAIYAGNAICTVKSNDSVKLITVRTTAFDKASSTDGASDSKVSVIDGSPDEITTFEKEELQKSDRPDLATAKVVIGGGRALKSSENFEMLNTLAGKLNAAVGASRAAVDAGYVDNSLQIGQTGKIIAPELYIAIGISGAIQHLAGMKDSKVIVAINKDADAPIFQIADYGLVGDLFKLIPELTEKV